MFSSLVLLHRMAWPAIMTAVFWMDLWEGLQNLGRGASYILGRFFFHVSSVLSWIGGLIWPKGEPLDTEVSDPVLSAKLCKLVGSWLVGGLLDNSFWMAFLFISLQLAS